MHDPIQPFLFHYKASGQFLARLLYMERLKVKLPFCASLVNMPTINQNIPYLKYEETDILYVGLKPVFRTIQSNHGLDYKLIICEFSSLLTGNNCSRTIREVLLLSVYHWSTYQPLIKIQI